MDPLREDLPPWLVTIPIRRPRDRHKGEQTLRVHATTAHDARTEAWRLAHKPTALTHRRGTDLIPTSPLPLHAEPIPN